LLYFNSLIGYITRQEFEEITAEFYPKIEATINRLFSLTNLTKENVYAVEMLGGSSRIPRGIF
jgi:molecular chaperone DnaK (HSP70)